LTSDIIQLTEQSNNVKQDRENGGLRWSWHFGNTSDCWSSEPSG